MSNILTVNPFFTPTQISGCQLWLDAADQNTIVLSNNLVSQWRDKSGNGRNMANLVGTIRYGPFQSRACVQQANGSSLRVVSAVDLTNLTFFIINCSTSTANNQTIFAGMNSGSGTDYNSVRGFGFYIDGNTNPTGTRFYGSNISGQYATNSITQVGIPYPFTIFVGRITSEGAISTFVNGATGGTASSGVRSSGSQGFALASTTGSNIGQASSRAFISEAIVYNTTLNVSERQQVEGYLAWKWSLQANLPATHPYKTSPIPPLLSPPTTQPSLLQNSFFSPTQISGCQLWLDAADQNTLTLSGTRVTQWRDKSGNGTIMTVSTGTPSLTNFNGLSSIYFNGSSRLQSLNYTRLAGASNINWFVVANIVNVNLNYGLLIGTLYSSNFFSQNTLYVHSNTLLNFFRRVAGSGATSLSTALSAGAFIGGSSVNFTNGVHTVARNGTVNTGTGGPTGTQDSTAVNLYIGNDNYPGDAFITGTISECLLYTSNLTISQRQQIEGYLAWKWGLQGSLPANHPFKNSPIPPLLNPPRSLVAIKSSVWQPTQISGCQLWLDAADRNTVTLSGTNVTQWGDKSGTNQNAIQNVNGRYPSYTRQINGNPVITMSSSGTTMFVSNFTVTQPPTVIVVWQKFGTSGANMFFIEQGPNLNTSPGFYISSGNWDAFGVRSASSHQQFYDTNLPTQSGGINNSFNTTGTTFLYVGQVSPNLWRLNGSSRNTTTTVNSGSPSGALTAQLNINSRNQSSVFGNILYCEIIIYNGNIALQNIQQIEGYLAWKWGLQGNLPATHPFKRWPPPP